MVLNIAVIIAVCLTTAGNMDATGSNIPKTNIEGPFSEQEIELAYPILKKLYCKKALQRNIAIGDLRMEMEQELNRAGLSPEIQFLPELTRRMAKMLEKNECQSEQ